LHDDFEEEEDTIVFLTSPTFEELFSATRRRGCS
jgi:hypothetical protein